MVGDETKNDLTAEGADGKELTRGTVPMTMRNGGPGKASRRGMLAGALSAGLGAAVLASGELPIVEADVLVKTPDGTCDAVLFHPRQGAHPGILLWPDAGGLREAFRELGRRVAAQGYTVLVPNHLYRSAR